MTWKDQHDLRINMSELATKVLASRGITFPQGVGVTPTELARQIQAYGDLHSTEYVQLLQRVNSQSSIDTDPGPPKDWAIDSYG